MEPAIPALASRRSVEGRTDYVSTPVHSLGLRAPWLDTKLRWSGHKDSAKLIFTVQLGCECRRYAKHMALVA